MREIGREEVRRLVTSGAQLVEVLPPEEYEEDHIAGAIKMPLRELDDRARAELDPARPVIVYCWDGA